MFAAILLLPADYNIYWSWWYYIHNFHFFCGRV